TDPNAKQTRYILATATTGGTFYPVGVAIATLSKQVMEPEHGVSLAAISSAGSEENLRLMRNEEAHFAILQGLYGAWARTGEGRLAKQPPFTELRSVTALWPNVEHMLVRADGLASGTLEDLRGMAGRRFSVGARFSGTEGSNRHILSALGLDPDTHFNLVYQGYGASAAAFQNQRIDGMNTPAGIPVGAVTRTLAAAGDQARLLIVSEAQRQQINQGMGELWQPFEIPADTYPGQAEAVMTIAQANLLAVRSDVPDEHVYQLLVTLYDNLGFLQAFHAATRAMQLDSAINGLPVPLHPGAVRFYRERGLAIPTALLPATATEGGDGG
ncbi:MAG: TAXI family TRAP transporter solute-binding subunit, partial [Pseudomonadota bacterium]